MKRILSALLCILMVLSLFSAAAFAEEETPIAEPETVTEPAPEPEPAPPADPVLVTGVTLSGESALTVGGASVTLTAAVVPEDASNKALSWSSSDTGVATVSGGVVSPVGAGTAVITAAATDGSGVSATHSVTVSAPAPSDPAQPPEQPPVQSLVPQNALPGEALEVHGDNDATTVAVGAALEILVSYVDNPGDTPAYTLSASPEGLVTIDQSTSHVTGVTEGEVTITAVDAADSTKTGSCVITVVAAAPTVPAIAFGGAYYDATDTNGAQYERPFSTGTASLELPIEASIENATGSLAYQWQFFNTGTTPGAWENFGLGEFPSSITDTLVFSTEAGTDGYMVYGEDLYRCVVTGTLSSGGTLEAFAYYTLTEKSGGDDPEPVTEAIITFTGEYLGRPFPDGNASYRRALETTESSFTLPIEATADEGFALSYEWQACNYVTNSWYSLARVSGFSGQDTSALTLTGAAVKGRDDLRCAVTATPLEGEDDPVTQYAYYTLFDERTLIEVLLNPSWAVPQAVPGGELSLYASVTPGNATVTPGNATRATVDWSSSDTSVATVSPSSIPLSEEGVLNADCTVNVAAGAEPGETVTITGTIRGTANGPALHSDSIELEIVDAVLPTGVWTSKSSVILIPSATANIIAHLVPGNAPDTALSCVSSSENVTVALEAAPDGLNSPDYVYRLTGVSQGTATLTIASVADPTVKTEIPVTVTNSSESALQAELDAAEFSVSVTSAIAISDALTVPAGKLLLIENGGSLTVAEDATLINNGSINVVGNPAASSALNVAAGGTLENNNFIQLSGSSGGTGRLTLSGTLESGGRIQVDSGGAFIVNASGVFSQNTDLGARLALNGGTVSGIDYSEVTGTVTIDSTTADPAAALAAAFSVTDYGGMDVTLNADVTLAGSLTIARGCALNISGGTLTIPSGYTLTSYGNIFASDGGHIVIGSGGAFTNAGFCALSQYSGIASTLTNNGTLTNFSTISLNDGCSLTNTGTYVYKDASHYGGTIWLYGDAAASGIENGRLSREYNVSTSADLITHLAANDYDRVTVNLLSAVFTLPQSLTISANTMLNLGDYGGSMSATLTIPAGARLTVDGNLWIAPSSKLIIEEGGLLQIGPSGYFNYDGDETRLENAGVIDESALSFGLSDVMEDENGGIYAMNMQTARSSVRYSVDDMSDTAEIQASYVLAVDLGPGEENRYQPLSGEMAASYDIENVTFTHTGSSLVSLYDGWGDRNMEPEVVSNYPYVFTLGFVPADAGGIRDYYEKAVTATITFTAESGKAPVSLTVPIGFDCVQPDTVTVTNELLEASYGGSLQAFIDSDAVADNRAHPTEIRLSGESYDIGLLTLRKNVYLYDGTLNGRIVLEGGTQNNESTQLYLWNTSLVGSGTGTGVKGVGDVVFQMYDSASVQNFATGVDMSAANYAHVHISMAAIAGCGVAMLQKNWLGDMEYATFADNDVVFRFCEDSPGGDLFYLPRFSTFTGNGVIVDTNGCFGHCYDLRYNYIASGQTVSNDDGIASVSYLLPYYANETMSVLSLEGGATMASGRRASFWIEEDYLAPIATDSIVDVLSDEAVDALDINVAGIADWSFNGGAPTGETSLPPTVNLSVDGFAEGTAAEIVELYAESEGSQVVDFAHEGALPYRADVTLYSSLEEGEYNLYYINEKTGKPELMPGQVTVTSSGTMTLSVDHCSTYLVGAIHEPAEVTSYAQLTRALADGETEIVVARAFTLAGNVEIPAGTTLTLKAKLSTGKYTLTVNGILTDAAGGALSVSASGGKLINNSLTEFYNSTFTLTVVSGGRIVNYSYLSVYGGTVTFNSGAVMENGHYFDIENGSDVYGGFDVYGGTVIFNSGASMINEGDFCTGDGLVNFKAGSTLTNRWYMLVFSEGELAFNGRYISNDGSLSLNATNGARITGSGIPVNEIEYMFDTVTDYNTLAAALEQALLGEYPNSTITIGGEITAEGPLTVPQGCMLRIEDGSDPYTGDYMEAILDMNGYALRNLGTLVFYSGAGLLLGDGSYNQGTMYIMDSMYVNGHMRNEGEIYIQAGAAVYLGSADAQLTNAGVIDVDSEGRFDVGEGQYGNEDAGELLVQQLGSKEAMIPGLDHSYQTLVVNSKSIAANSTNFANACNPGDYRKKITYFTTGEYTLTTSTTIPENAVIYLMDAPRPGTWAPPTTLSVPSGVTLTVEGALYVSEGATLHLDEGATVKTKAPTGVLFIEDGCLENDGGTVEDNYNIVTDLASLQAALAAEVTELYILDPVTLARDPHSMEPVHLALNTTNGAIPNLYLCSTLTVGDGVHLSNLSGLIFADADAELVVEGGAQVDAEYLNAELGRVTVNDGGTLDNADQIYWIKSFYGGTMTNAAVQAAVQQGAEQLRIWSGVSTSGSVTIPASVGWVDIRAGGSLTVKAGTTLTNNSCIGVGDYATLTFAAGAKYAGTGSIIVKRDGELVTNGLDVPHRKEGVLVREILLEAGLPTDGGAVVGNGVWTPVKVTVLPANAGGNLKLVSDPAHEESDAVDFSSTGEGVEDAYIWISGIDSADVWVEAYDGSGVSSNRITLTAVPYAIEINEPASDDLAAGKTMQLTAGFTPANLTDARVVWSLEFDSTLGTDPDAEWETCPADIAVINSASGVITAKAVTAAHRLRAVARTTSIIPPGGPHEPGLDDSMPAEDSYTFTLRPPATSVQIVDVVNPFNDDTEDDVIVTGQTLTLDLNKSGDVSIPLEARLFPEGAFGGVTWKTSNAKVVKIETIEGKDCIFATRVGVGTATVTATAKTGGKSASVKINVAALATANSLRLAAVEDTFRQDGGNGYYLLAGERGEIAYDFDIPLPSNTNVNWTVDVGESCVTLSPRGTSCLVTAAKALVRTTNVELTATAADGSGEEETFSFYIVPLAAQVRPFIPPASLINHAGISWDDAKAMLTVNLNHPDAKLDGTVYKNVYFGFTVKPDDAGDELVVISSDSRLEKYAELTHDDTGGGGTQFPYYLTPTGNTGKVTVTATADDGSRVKTAITVLFVKEAASADIVDKAGASIGDMELLGGKSLQLYADFANKTRVPGLTDRKAYWSVSLEDDGEEDASAFATISASGKLTARTIQQAIDVYVTLRTTSGVASDTVKVTLRPAVQYVTLAEITGVAPDEMIIPLIPGESMNLDLTSAPAEIRLRASVFPGDAFPDVSWKISGAAAILRYEDGDPVIGAIADARNATGYKTGPATVTATAGGKKVILKLQVGVPVEDVEIDADSVPSGNILNSGKSVTLKAKTLPANATVPGVTWSLPDPADAAYVTLSATTGKVTAKTVYEQHVVTVFATSKDGWVFDMVDLAIRPASAVTLVLKETDLNTYLTKTTVTGQVPQVMEVGAYLLGASGEPDLPVDVTWDIGRSTVIGISDGRTTNSVSVTALKAGTANLKATYKDANNKTYTAQMTLKVTTLVDEVNVSGKGFASPTQPTVASGKSLQMLADVSLTDGRVLSPKDASKAVTWSLVGPYGSDGSEYAKISTSGMLTANKGLTDRVTVRVTATAKDGSDVSSTCDVLLTPLATAVDILHPDTGEVYTGRTLTYDLGTSNNVTDRLGAARVYPWSGDEYLCARQDVVWTSSNPRVARIVATVGFPGGGGYQIELLTPGTVTIKATAADGSGKSASYRITVVRNPVQVGITTPDGFTCVRAGARTTLKPVFNGGQLPAPSNTGVTWSLTDGAAFASISASGVLTTKAAADQYTVAVKAVSKANPAIYCVQRLAVLPAVKSVSIIEMHDIDEDSDDVVVTGKTITIPLADTAAEGDVVSAIDALCAPLGSRPDVTWTSSKPAILTIEDVGRGNVKLGASFKPGSSVVITAKANDGSGKSAKVTVKLVKAVTEITLMKKVGKTLTPANTPGEVVRVGSRLSLSAAVLPANATLKSVTWSLRPEDLAYATVSASGVVTPRKVTEPHTVYLTCEAKDGFGGHAQLLLLIAPKDYNLAPQ